MKILLYFFMSSSKSKSKLKKKKFDLKCFIPTAVVICLTLNPETEVCISPTFTRTLGNGGVDVDNVWLQLLNLKLNCIT